MLLLVKIKLAKEFTSNGDTGLPYLVLLLHSSKSPPEHAYLEQLLVLHTLYCMLPLDSAGSYIFQPVLKCSS